MFVIASKRCAAGGDQGLEHAFVRRDSEHERAEQGLRPVSASQMETKSLSPRLNLNASSMVGMAAVLMSSAASFSRRSRMTGS